MSNRCGISFSLKLLHPKHWLTWFGLGLFFLVAQLPITMRHRLGRTIGNIIFKNKSQKRRRVVNSNLKIAFPNLTTETRDAMTLTHLQWYGCAMIDYSLLFFASKKRLNKLLQIDGREHIDRAIDMDKNIIILLAHSVMLEFGPAALGMRYNCFGSYKTSKSPVLDWMIAKSRCRHVKFVISREEGLRKMVKSLIPKQLMIFLPDEDLGLDNATFVPFFNKQKATLTTTSRIAKMGKAAALPAFVWFDLDTNKYRLHIMPALENYPSNNANADALRMNQAFEILIKQHPEQYMWLMKWYKTRPENEEMVYK